MQQTHQLFFTLFFVFSTAVFSATQIVTKNDATNYNNNIIFDDRQLDNELDYVKRKGYKEYPNYQDWLLRQRKIKH